MYGDTRSVDQGNLVVEIEMTEEGVGLYNINVVDVQTYAALAGEL